MVPSSLGERQAGDQPSAILGPIPPLDPLEVSAVPRPRRRRSGGLGYAPRAGSLFLASPRHARRRRRRGPSLSVAFVLVVVLAGLAAGAYALVHRQLDSDHRHEAVE